MNTTPRRAQLSANLSATSIRRTHIETADRAVGRWSGLSDDGSLDPPREQRPCRQLLQRFLLRDVVLVVRQMAERVANGFEAADAEAQHAGCHRRTCLLAFDVGEAQPGHAI